MTARSSAPSESWTEELSDPTSLVIFVAIGACAICVVCGLLKKYFPNQCDPEATPEGKEAIERMRLERARQIREERAAPSPDGDE